jgi:phosphoribosylglycinamide formyltransferase-1
MAPGKLKVGVLISGRGSNMEALLSAAAAPDYPAEIVLVISNRPQAAGLQTARDLGIPAQAIDHKAVDDHQAFEIELTKALAAAGVELVALAGFMRVLTASFVARWHDRLINIHPSLLPLFPGLDTHERALDAGVKLHGCTVHFVRAEMDAGPIIGQAAVPVLADDDADSLAARVLTAEHRLYPHCLRLIAEGRVRVEGDRARIEGLTDEGAVLINPSPED